MLLNYIQFPSYVARLVYLESDHL